MASISTSIELYDRVSAPVNKMLVALNHVCGAFEDIDKTMDGSFDTARIQEAQRAIQQAGAEMNSVAAEIEQSTQEQEKFNNSVHRGTGMMGGLIGKAVALVGAYAGMRGIKSMMDMSDELTSNTARVNMMNDGLQTTPELMNMIYKSAQDARGDFGAMTAVVAKFGNNAKDAFSSSAEVVSFANLIQKQMVIAGASGTEASNAMLQLSQALGSGVLRGDELNSIFEQAPNLIGTIADYMGVSIGQIRQMASEGQITADIVKNAMFAASDDINQKFSEIPMTWGQVWTMAKNTAVEHLQPVLQKINELANNTQFQTALSGLLNGLSVVAVVMLNIMEIAGNVASFISEHWSVIAPIVMGIVTAMGLYLAALAITNTIAAISAGVMAVKAAADAMAAGATFGAAVAQYGFNAALLACPITWIIGMIIIAIALIFAVASAIAKMTGIAHTGFGVITGGINVVIQFFKNLGLTVANIALGIGGAISALCSNMSTAFSNTISGVQSWFYGLLSTALTVVGGICEALNKLPFVEFDYSGITSKAQEYANKAAEAAADKGEYKDVGEAFTKGMNTYDAFPKGWASDAFANGAAWGDGVMDKFKGLVDTKNPFGSDFDPNAFGNLPATPTAPGAGSVPSDVGSIADNTGKIADNMDITSEELKYLRDIAERDAVNRFTTAEIKIEMTNNNNVASTLDLDGIVDHLTAGVNEAMEKAAEGVY